MELSVVQTKKNPAQRRGFTFFFVPSCREFVAAGMKTIAQ